MLVVPLILPATDSFASTPRLTVITPRGVQRGLEHTLRFNGARLTDSQQVFLYDSGIEVLELTQIDASNIDVKIRVDEDCRLGEHIAQVRTKRGISDFRSFYVGSMPDVVENEPNNSIEQPQSIQQNQTINGVIENEDIDVFKVTCKQGQRLSIEIEAMRLGALFDPFVAVLNSENFELAISDDSNLNQQDSLICLQVPEDGDYFVLVRESSYGGNANCRYRLHVGDFPRPTVAFPAGGKPGGESEVRFIGDAAGDIVRQVQVPQEFGFRDGLFVDDEHGICPSPVSFRISDLDNQFEREPNQDRTKLEKIHALPAAFNGVIGKSNDMDYFKFTAEKGQVFDVECYARRIRSGLDPVIHIFDAKGKLVAGDDDARRPDSYLRLTVPETGDYFLRIKDHLRHGQPDFVYRVEISAVKPHLRIGIPRNDRYSQLRQQICVPRGNRFAVMFSAGRDNFAGPLELMDVVWPDGIVAETKTMSANLTNVPIVFSAAEDAELSGDLVDVKFRMADPKREITGRFRNLADFAYGPPNNARYYGAVSNRLPVAVTEKIPFKLDIVQPNSPLVRDGSMRLKIVATRDEGFDKPITVQFPFRPPGVGTKPQIKFNKGQTEVYYPLNANSNAQIGKWPVYAIGQSDIAGPVWASTQLAELEVAEPYVTVELNRTVCSQGDSPTIVCKLNHHRSFEGKATAELLGVPPNIAIPKLTFTKETTDLTFTVSTTEKSPIGKHRGLFCRLTITENGEPIVSTAARSELQINKPQPKVAAFQPTAEKKPALPKQKAKSRLEQLREAKASKAGQVVPPPKTQQQ